MKKKWQPLFLIIPLVTISTVVGCNLREPTKEEVYEEFQNRTDKITSYTCTANVEAIGNKSNTTYILKHTYTKPDYYKLEVESPENIKGKIMEYKSNKIIIHNPEINDVIELPNQNNKGTYLFVGDFIENYLENETAELELLENQLIISVEIPGDNRYINKQRLYVNTKTKNPEKMEILDKEGVAKFIVTYENFECEK